MKKNRKYLQWGLVILLLIILASGLFIIKNIKSKQEKGMDMGKQVLDDFLAKFYVTDENGGSIAGEYFWTQAEIFEIILDACELTGDKKYFTILDEMYRGFVTTHGEDWAYNDFNDDIMWMNIACVRAYNLTGDSKYLDQAKKHFDLVFERAWSDDLGGGLFWRTENTTKNSCINNPAVIAACLLGEALKEETYFEKARDIYKWQKENLFGADGAVYDAYDLKNGVNKWCSTYNQGTFIGAASLLYEHYKEETYLEDAKLAADYTMNVMFHGEVMNTEESGNDLPGFKGILARWMGKYAKDYEQEECKEWLRTNAQTALNNKNSSGIIWTQWNNKTQDTFYSAWGCSAAVSMLLNCPYE